MEPIGELLAVDQERALAFFVAGLRDVSESAVDRQELLYNASVLAHFAQVSTRSTIELPAPADLDAVFDHFVASTAIPQGALMMETAGAQCLLLTGFFEDQMRRRHSIPWYSQLGAGFFSRAASYETSRQKAELLLTLASHFEAWRRRHARLSRELREQSALLSRGLRIGHG